MEIDLTLEEPKWTGVLNHLDEEVGTEDVSLLQKKSLKQQ
jgi:hypothetical protein